MREWIQHKKWVAAMLHGIMVLILAGLYFSNWEGVKTTGVILRDFYRPLKPGMARVTEAELKGAHASGNPGDWETMLLRTAMGRWRLRQGGSPIPFENLMADYEAGPWISPSREEWENLLTDIDNAWRESRQSAARGGELTTLLDPTTNRITIAGEVATWELGSRISLIMECPRDDAPVAGATMLWDTGRARGPSSYRAKGLSYEAVAGAPEGRQRFKLVADFSNEPAWLSPLATNPGFTLRGVKEATLIAMEADDSPLLPINP